MLVITPSRPNGHVPALACPPPPPPRARSAARSPGSQAPGTPGTFHTWHRMGSYVYLPPLRAERLRDGPRHTSAPPVPGPAWGEPRSGELTSGKQILFHDLTSEGFRQGASPPGGATSFGHKPRPSLRGPPPALAPGEGRVGWTATVVTFHRHTWRREASQRPLSTPDCRPASPAGLSSSCQSVLGAEGMAISPLSDFESGLHRSPAGGSGAAC